MTRKFGLKIKSNIYRNQKWATINWATLLSLLIGAQVKGAGISVDAGLTPPEDRWILRNQLRYMTRKNDQTSMDRHTSIYKFPTVLAYGVTSDFSVMIGRRTISYK